MTIVIACGLKREARIIERVGGAVTTVVGGGVAEALERRLEAAAISSLRHPGEGRGPVAAGSMRVPGLGQGGDWGKGRPLVLSCGIAGALDAALRPGDVVIDGDAGVLAYLRAALPDATVGRVMGSDTIAATAARKRAITAETGGVTVDMESHVAARVAKRHGLPFGAVRVISDRLEDDLPPAALVGMKPDGGMALGAVLVSLAKAPGQLPALLRTGRQADAAFAGLKAAMAAVVGTEIDRVEPDAARR